jgi:hypothetical protein
VIPQRLVIVRRRQHFDELLEWPEIALLDCGLNCFFNPVIARNERWTDGPHITPALRGGSLVAGKATSPTQGPLVKGGRIVEEAAHGLVILYARIRKFTESAEGESKVGPVLRHSCQQILGERRIAFQSLAESQLSL